MLNVMIMRLADCVTLSLTISPHQHGNLWTSPTENFYNFLPEGWYRVNIEYTRVFNISNFQLVETEIYIIVYVVRFNPSTTIEDVQNTLWPGLYLINLY